MKRSEQAVEVDVEGTTMRVFTAEHLAAITLQTERAKDKALLLFVESGAPTADRFKDVVSRHNMSGGWERFERQFLSDNP